MRQSGIIPAGALYALENNIDRLADDHQCAQVIASAVSAVDGLTLEPAVVDTNIVIFRIDAEICGAQEFCDRAKEQGAWMLPFSGEHVRAVTHLHISNDEAIRAGEIIKELIQSMVAV